MTTFHHMKPRSIVPSHGYHQVLIGRFEGLAGRNKALDAVVRVFDVNGDGLVDFEEFARGLVKV